MPRGQKYTKGVRLILLLLFLICLPPSQELLLGWGGEGDDSKMKDVSGGALANLRKISKKHTLQKKFKFHEIELLKVLDDDDEEDGLPLRDNNNNESVDDGDGEEEESDSQRDHAVSLNSENNDDDEEKFQFKRARKAEKKFMTRSLREASKRKESKSFFNNILGGLYSDGGSDGSNENIKTRQSIDNESQEEYVTKSNGIIDWLIWLRERIGRLREVTIESEEENISASSGENWLHYFNRWPFNSLFPIGKPTKPISMPKTSSSKSKRKHTEICATDADDNSHKEKMSLENFYTLIRTLPNFVFKPSEVLEDECRQHLQIFENQLRGRKLWTLQMLDSTGKVSNGLLRGNINQFGDFVACTRIKTLVKVDASEQVRMRGKYCLAHIETQAQAAELKIPVHMLHGRSLFNSHLGNPSHFIPRYGVAKWGVCVPSGCSAGEVQNMIQSNLESYNSTGIEFHVEVSDNDCYVQHSRKFLNLMKKDKKFCATLLYILSLALLTLANLTWENWSLVRPIRKNFSSICKILIEKIKKKLERSETAAENPEKDKEENEELAGEMEDETESKNQTTTTETSEEEEEDEDLEEAAEENLSPYHLALEIFKSFSPHHTLSVLLAPDTHDAQFPVFHVLKIAATFMMYLCLKFLMIGHMPIINRDQLVRILDHPLSVLIRSPVIYADVLLLISGFLSAYQLSKEMEQKSYIQLLKRLCSKVSRYIPTVYLLICFQAWVLPYLSSGPLWTSIVGQSSRLCDDQWWRNLLSLQNAIDFEETCSPSTIQLALEVQLYILGPLVVWLFYTDSDAGFFVYGALHAMSVAARYSRTNKEHLSMTLFHGINVSKFYRTANILYSSPISRATTYLLGIGAGIFQRTNQGVIDLTPEMIPFGWILASIGILWCLWSPSSGMRTDCIYTSSEAASFASWCPLVFGLSLCWFIFMFPKSENSVVNFLLSSKPILVISRLTFPMQLVTYIVVLFNTAKIKEADKFHISDLINVPEILQVLLGSMIVSFLIDIPSQNIRHLLVNRIFLERVQSANDDQEVLGVDPSDESEEISDNIKSGSPKPPHKIWGWDAEEEESKYIATQTSSLKSQ